MERRRCAQRITLTRRADEVGRQVNDRESMAPSGSDRAVPAARVGQCHDRCGMQEAIPCQVVLFDRNPGPHPSGSTASNSIPRCPGRYSAPIVLHSSSVLGTSNSVGTPSVSTAQAVSTQATVLRPSRSVAATGGRSRADTRRECSRQVVCSSSSASISACSRSSSAIASSMSSGS